MSIATSAPTPEQTAFTASLSKRATPPACRVAVPQLWTARSVDFAHTSHQRRACNTAPRRESASPPANPPSAAAAKGTGQWASVATAPMNTAPPAPAIVPIRVMPPDVPGGTLLAEIIETGSPPASVPTSVDQVSAADAASAPKPTAYQCGDGKRRYPSAARAYTPPFARTCRASRSPAFCTTGPTSSAFFRSPSFERALAATKCESRRTPQLQPAATASVPKTAAVTAPLVESVPVRRARNATETARRPPAKIESSCIPA
jgi:hypothetical protein